MSRIPLFIDFDRVLFDTDTMREKLCSCLIDAGFSSNATIQAYKAAASGHQYLPVNHIAEVQKLEPENKIDPEGLLEKMHNEIEDLRYPETELFLQDLNRKDYEISLLTLGDPEFQQRKIECAHISSYFDHITICTVEKADFLETHIDPTAPFILIDDRLDTIQAVQARYPASFTFYKDYKNEHPEFALERSARIVQLNDVRRVTLPAPFTSLLLAELP